MGFPFLSVFFGLASTLTPSLSIDLIFIFYSFIPFSFLFELMQMSYSLALCYSLLYAPYNDI